MREVSNEEFELVIADDDVLGIAKFVVAQYKTIHPDEAELLVYQAVWEALRRFDNRRECKFTSYLYRCARWVCATHIKGRMKERKMQPLSDSMTDSDRVTYTNTAMVDLKADLTDDEFELLHDRYVGGLLLKEIAEKRDISVEWARLKIERLLETVNNRA